MLNVARNLGGSIGISSAQTLLASGLQRHQSELVNGLSPLNPNYNEWLAKAGSAFGGVGDPTTTPLAVLYQTVQRQASMLAFLDVFHTLMIVVLCVAPVVFFMRSGKHGPLTRSFVTTALLGATLLAGCTVGPNYHAPEMPVPPAFGEAQPAAPGATIDPAHWWTAFGDPTLTSLVERALKDSPNIAIAGSRVRQARLQEIAAHAVGKPTVDATGNVTHVEFSKNSGLSSLASLFSGSSSGGFALPGSGITTYAAGFDASWEIDLFGGGRRSVE
eukprot:gene35193-41482_t